MKKTRGKNPALQPDMTRFCFKLVCNEHVKMRFYCYCSQITKKNQILEIVTKNNCQTLKRMTQ